MSPLASRQAKSHALPSWTPWNPLRVVIDWSAGASKEPSLLSTRVELEADSGQDAGLETRWMCRQPSGTKWEEVVASADCAEVVVTAELGDDPDAKHRVFGLAERLARLLSATHPSVRVRFLPRPSRRTEPARASTRRQ